MENGLGPIGILATALLLTLQSVPLHPSKMDIQALIWWHSLRADEAHGDEALIHRDAIELLRWCVELPSCGGPHAHLFAFERAAEACLDALADVAPENYGEECAEVMQRDRRFWQKLQENVIEQMPMGSGAA